MNDRQKCQRLCFAIEGIGSFGTVLYTTYIYFYLHDRFQFGDKANLTTAACMGVVYALASWQSGRFAQRYGHFSSLRIGFGGMIAALIASSLMHSVAGLMVAATLFFTSICFTWPALEALVTECEEPDRIPHAVGVYNITWAITNALAFFIGGTLIQTFGYRGIFYIPAGLMLVQLALTQQAEKHFKRIPTHALTAHGNLPHDANRPSPERAKCFLHLAWVANPFAYVAINTLVAVLPGVAEKFHFSPMMAGFACSLWGFMRLGVFILLWRWTAWHYRFRWLALAFGLLIGSFGTILLSSNMLLMLGAQVFFGAAIGLIYYSSLFYSMDASDTKSEHGGIHEAAIGLGNCVGPAVGAASLQFASQHAGSGVMAVSGLLVLGFAGMVGIWKMNR